VPAIQTPNGRTVYIPGVYVATRVRSSLPGPLPAFHVPVMLASSWEGHPYNADSTQLAVEPRMTPFSVHGTAGALAEHYGAQSPMHRAMTWAKRHGLPLAFACSLSALTRASIVVHASGAVEQCTLYTRRYGAPANWTRILWDGTANQLEITKVKQYAMVETDIGATDTRIYLQGAHGWAVKGSTVTIAANSETPVTRTITRSGTEQTAAGQTRHYIEVSSAPGALTTAAYAIVLQYDEPGRQVLTGITDAQTLIDTINEQETPFWAVKHANFTNDDPIDVATATAINAISAWGTVVAGTSPAHTDADVDAFVTLMNASGFEDFVSTRELLPQTYLLVSDDSTQHAAMRDYAVAEDIRGYPISVTTGCGWGDTVIGAGDDTDPEFRAGALDNQDFCLCAGGLDGEDAYLSLAPAVWARRVAGGPGHNLTNDRLIMGDLETRWDQINSGELSDLHRAGVVTYKLSIGQSIAWKISQGLSTLQANEGAIWNEVDGTTWSLMQRDLANFVNRTIMVDFEELLVGADEVNPAAVAAVLINRAERSLLERGYILEFRVESVGLNAAGSGYDVAWSARLPTTNDFMTSTLTILIGE